MTTLLSLTIFFLLFLSVSGHGAGNHDDDPTAEKPDLRSKSLILVKIWCLILVFAGTFAGGISPYFLKWNDAFLVLGTQFAGGVFLGTALMHFLSDANETFRDLTDKSYPFAFMLASAGYLVTLLADCSISFVFRKQGNGREGDIEGHADEMKSSNGQHSQSRVQDHEGIDAHTVKPSLAIASSLGDSILLILALCFHSIFEGIAIGVAETKGGAWKAMWTVSLHKIFAAIAMGIALLRMIPDRPLLSCTAYAFAFAISSPIGVAIGIIIDATAQGAVADWIYAISMSLACGVFIYVSINHLLSKNFALQSSATLYSPFLKFFAVTFGVGVIAIVMIWDT
ncbi:zinc transporter 11 precursor [Tasmannia lanceolata]|uniref:zinc transporter 11 precursor n=1 Tax=Tasmannia lanceolata TaxID=3420 RepID=UPI004063038A